MPNPDWKRKLKVLLAITLVLPQIYLIVYNRTFSFGNFVYLASITQTIDELLHANTSRVLEEAMKLKSFTTNFTITSDKDTSTNHPIVADLYTLKGTIKGNDGHYKTERNKITASIAHLTTAPSVQLSRFTCREKQLDEMENIFHVPEVNCGKLLSGDLNEMVNSKKYVKLINRTLLSEQFYLNLTTNCELFQSQRGFIMCPLTSEEENFPIAFSMMVYKDVEMVERLLRSIYRPQNYYCIHVDKKSDEQFIKAVSDITSCFDNIFLAPERVNVTWGEYSVLEPELICMKHLWKYKKWKYFINLTGQEFPLKTNWELVQILKAYNGANDLLGTVNRTIRRRWRTQPPHNLTVVQGSVHIVVNRDFVDYILHNQTAKDLLDWVKHTIIPDETFFTMLNHNPQLGIRTRREQVDGVRDKITNLSLLVGPNKLIFYKSTKAGCRLSVRQRLKMCLKFLGKRVLLVLNVIVMLTGLAFLVCGSLLAYAPSTILKKIFDFAKEIDKAESSIALEAVENITDFPVLHEVGLAVMLFGAFLMVLGCLVFCGTFSVCCKWLLIVFVIAMSALMIVQIVVCSFFFINDSSLHSTVKDKLKTQLEHYNKMETNDTFSQTMNLIQLYYGCCGIDSATDYKNRPKSCKKNTIGCYTKLNDVVQDNIKYAGTGLGIILLIQLVECIIAVAIFRQTKTSSII
ncbi:Beta-1,3-galactosyl-O-glycosyl-glycoprotein beta-1,6-N-acetylglucosaminyltransferase 3 [Bulinus truncatus]|nr:Beta-1,3-galactosyl-O-glycosyl-glycoprotein beta-1,6-N-acetylglucosaminyltransferase 3 [Bulinus truncatus]